MTRLFRTGALTLVGLSLVGVAVAGSATPQQREADRRRQLAVFEELLTETIQERVSARVNDTIDAARRGDPDGDGVVSDVAAEPLVVKVGSPMAAHGLFVDGYGVMFSIESPQVSVIPQSFERMLAQPRTLLRFNSDGSGQNVFDTSGVIELRADLIDRSIDDLILHLERAPEGLYEVRVEELENLKGTLEEVRRAAEEESGSVTAEVTVGATVGEAPPETDPELERHRRESAAEGSLLRARGLSRGNRWAGFYRDAVEQSEQVREVLERNRRQVADAMAAAAIETIAHYGSLIKGLDDNARVAVIIMPPMNWGFARGLGVGVDDGEHVVSARYKDIRELDNGKIDYDEFVSRAQIRDRLGLEVSYEDGAQP